MITAVRALKKDERGQSVIEFLFMLPVMVGLVVLMVRINSAIQVSIVDQQYARSQALFLAFNHNTYPEIPSRYANLIGKHYDQMMLGVSDNLAPRDGEPYNPTATTQMIVRTRALASQADNQPQTEPDPNSGGTRAFVRIRNTVSLCTQSNFMTDGTPILSLSGGTASYNLQENSKFDYCKGEVDE